MKSKPLLSIIISLATSVKIQVVNYAILHCVHITLFWLCQKSIHIMLEMVMYIERDVRIYIYILYIYTLSL